MPSSLGVSSSGSSSWSVPSATCRSSAPGPRSVLAVLRRPSAGHHRPGRGQPVARQAASQGFMAAAVSRKRSGLSQAAAASRLGVALRVTARIRPPPRQGCSVL